MAVNAWCKLDIIESADEIVKGRSPAGKPFLRITLEDGTKVDLSLNLAEMIGGAAQGARRRYEEAQARSN